MFKALLKTRLLALWHTMFVRSSKKKQTKGTKIALGIFAVYVILMLLGNIAMMFNSLAESFINAGLDWLYFALAGIMGFMLCFVGSIFMTQSMIFESKDTEMLMSMPIPAGYIALSRFAPIFVLNFVYNAAILLPAWGVYTANGGSMSKAHFVVPLVIISPLLTCAVACLLGWLSALVSSGRRGKVVLQLVFSIGFLGAYMVIATNLQKYLNLLIQNGESIATAIEKSLPPFYWLGMASIGDTKSFIIFTAVSLVLCAGVYALIASTFLRISSRRSTQTKKKYVRAELKTSGVRSALVKKELSRFFTMSLYMLNCGIGAILMLLLSGALIVKGEGVMNTLFAFPGSSEYLPGILCSAIAFCAVMINLSSASLSLEGKSFSLLKSMPLRASDIFFAKIASNLVISIPPTVIAVATAAYILDCSVSTKLAVAFVCLCAALFGACFGAAINAHFPKFDWINPTVVIKQGMSVMIYLFTVMGLLATGCALFALMRKYMGLDTYLFVFGAVIALASASCVLHLKKSGDKLFEEMN